jgi:hypothetical protein
MGGRRTASGGDPFRIVLDLVLLSRFLLGAQDAAHCAFVSARNVVQADPAPLFKSK